MHDAYDAVFHGGIGFIATVFAVLVTYPLQTLRTRMQVGHTTHDTYRCAITYAPTHKHTNSHANIIAHIVEHTIKQRLSTPHTFATHPFNTHSLHTSSSYTLVLSFTRSLHPDNQVRTNKTAAHKTSSGSSLLQRDLCNGLREKLLSSAICEFTFFFARRVLENLFLPSPPPT